MKNIHDSGFELLIKFEIHIVLTTDLMLIEFENTKIYIIAPFVSK